MAHIIKNDFSWKGLAMLLLMAFSVTFAVIFIEEYCAIFSAFGFIAKNRLVDQPVVAFIITPVFFWMSAYLCRKFANNASGNSIDHIRDALKESEKRPENFEKMSDFLGARVIMVKTISSLLCVFGGGALGREGPAAHMTSGIFAVMSYRFRAFLPKAKLETWVIAGSATGMAIAFYAPISGFVFAFEKILKSKTNHFFINTAWVLIATLMSAIALRHYDMLFVAKNMQFQTSYLLYVLLTAVMCGVIAFFFKKLNKFLYQKFAAIKSNFWHLIPISAGLLVALISFYCGVYSFSGGIYTVDEALLSSDILLSYKEVGGRIANTIISFVSGCAGGLVAPAIAIGTGIGSIIGSLVPGADMTVFLLIGMAAFLGAALGEPVTAAIIIFEITGQSAANIPLLLSASVIAFVSFKLMDKGFAKVKKII